MLLLEEPRTRVRMCDLENGQFGRDIQGKFWTKGDWCLVDELGRTTQPVDDELMVEVYPKRILTEGESFHYCRGARDGMPSETLILQRDDGWRFRVDCRDYRVIIPVSFLSTDPRVGMFATQWIGRSGRLIDTLKRADSLYITVVERPVLYIHSASGVNSSVPSEPIHG